MKDILRKIIIPFCLVVVFLSAFNLLAEAGSKGGTVRVRGYTRKDGTYVPPHYRSAPDGNPFNNWSYPGNINPYTGKEAPGNPDTYLERYYNRGSNKIHSPGLNSPSLEPTTESTPSQFIPTPNYNPTNKTNATPMTELERLFGTEKSYPVKQRSGSLADVF